MNSNRFECTHCKRSYKHKQTLKRHIVKFPNNSCKPKSVYKPKSKSKLLDNNKLSTCSRCFKCFDNEALLLQHLNRRDICTNKPKYISYLENISVDELSHDIDCFLSQSSSEKLLVNINLIHDKISSYNEDKHIEKKEVHSEVKEVHSEDEYIEPINNINIVESPEITDSNYLNIGYEYLKLIKSDLMYSNFVNNYLESHNIIVKKLLSDIKNNNKIEDKNYFDLSNEYLSVLRPYLYKIRNQFGNDEYIDDNLYNIFECLRMKLNAIDHFIEHGS